MPLTNAYTSLPTLKLRLRLTASDDDARLESAITAASRQIDRVTGRRFYAASDTRYYTPTDPYCLMVDDLLSVTTLKTDEDGDRTYERTWDSSDDYYLAPYNAVADGRPYTSVEVDRYNGDYLFPLLPRSVQLVGSFGHNATGSHPAEIEEACLRMAERLYVLPTAPLGVAGSVETGIVRIASDRDVAELLWPFRRRRGFA